MNKFYCKIQGKSVAAAGVFPQILGTNAQNKITVQNNFKFLSFSPKKVNLYVNITCFTQIGVDANAGITVYYQERAKNSPVKITIEDQSFFLCAKDGFVKIPLSTQAKQQLNNIDQNNVDQHISFDLSNYLPRNLNSQTAGDYVQIDLYLEVKNEEK